MILLVASFLIGLLLSTTGSYDRYGIQLDFGAIYNEPGGMVLACPAVMPPAPRGWPFSTYESFCGSSTIYTLGIVANFTIAFSVVQVSAIAISKMRKRA